MQFWEILGSIGTAMGATATGLFTVYNCGSKTGMQSTGQKRKPKKRVNG